METIKKIGFEREGRLRKNVYFWRDIDNCPIWKDTFIYARVNNSK